MKCECGTDTKTKDSRRIEQGIWRRRFCPSCGAEFTTLEQRCETLVNPYTSKAGAREKKGQVIAPPVPAVKRPQPPNQRAIALRKPAEPALKPKPLPAERQVVRAAPKAVDRVETTARDRIEDLKFEREQRDHGWD